MIIVAFATIVMSPSCRCVSIAIHRIVGDLAVTYRFGPYTLDPAAYRLLRDAEVVQLSPKIIDLLLYLVARQPALVSKEDLFKALWPDVAVTDNALTQAVSELRQALGDDSSKPVYVQTVARRGYRFIAPVTTTAPAATAASPDRAAPARPRPSRSCRRSRCSISPTSAATASSRGSRPASPKPSPTISAPRRPSASSIACASSSRSSAEAPIFSALRRRPAPRPGGRRELSAIGPAAADHRARRRRGDRRSDGRSQGRRSARAGLRAPGSHRSQFSESAADRRPSSRARSAIRAASRHTGPSRRAASPGVSRRVGSPGRGR